MVSPPCGNKVLLGYHSEWRQYYKYHTYLHSSECDQVILN